MMRSTILSSCIQGVFLAYSPTRRSCSKRVQVRRLRIEGGVKEGRGVRLVQRHLLQAA